MSEVIAYHVIMGTHGFWLPNDPRGSGSTEVRAANLRPFGPASFTASRRSVADVPHDRTKRLAAKLALKTPEVFLSPEQVMSVGRGFATQIAKSGYCVRAAAILPHHAHLVVMRHHYPIEQVERLLRQAATMQLLADGLHPFASQRMPGGRLPSIWGQDFWKVFLYTMDELVRAIRYVEKTQSRMAGRRSGGRS